MYRIKDWHQFQHFKDRRPPWIKLYRQILDDIEWHSLSGDDAKHLVMLWLIASEDDGNLPCSKQLSFRLRITEQQLAKTCIKLSHWLIQDDINAISDRYQHDTPETETETETETEVIDTVNDAAERIWNAYPKKVGKKDGMKRIEQALRKTSEDVLINAIREQFSSITDLKYVPNPSTWFNGERWNDLPVSQNSQPTQPVLLDLPPVPREELSRDWSSLPERPLVPDVPPVPRDQLRRDWGTL
jgi:hypothetical protein